MNGCASGKSEPPADSDRRQAVPYQGVPHRGEPPPVRSWDEWGEDNAVQRGGSRLSEQEIDEQGQCMVRRQRNFRLAADVVTAAFAQLPEVERVMLFGSVAVPLEREVPRFRKYRRHRIAFLHQCKDVDLAVWMSDLAQLQNLRQARSRALIELYQKQQVGVAHHQVEVFIMDPETDRYLGRLCAFTRSPKDKLDCLVPGCGDTPHLKQQKGFVLTDDALADDRTITLFDRQGGAPLQEDNHVRLP